MPPDHETLLRLATRPLEDNAELHLAARGDLDSHLRQNATSDSAVASAIDSFQRADQRGLLSRHWRKAIYLGALAAAVFIGYHTITVRKAVIDFLAITGMLASGVTPKLKVPAHLSERDVLILHGDRNAGNESDRWMALWDSDPSNPVFFAQYVHGVFSDTSTLPPDLLEEAALIDPGNGWYPAIRAGALIDGTVVRGKQSTADQTALKSPTYTVKHPEKLAEAVRLIHQAAAAERINSRQEELVRLQIPLLGERTDWISQVRITAHVAAITAAGSIAVNRLRDAFPAEAQRLADEGNRDEFLRLIESWETITRLFIEGGWTLVDLLIAKVMVVSPATTFRDAALKLGLEKEAGRFEAIAAWGRDDKERRNRKGISDPNLLVIERRGSIMAGLTAPMLARQVENPPPLTKTDLLPSRLAEHALSQRFLMTPSLMILALAAGLASLRFACSSRMNRKLSARLTDLLQRRDWMLVLPGGAVFPIVLYLVLVYLSPLSGREWSLRPMGFTPFFAYMAAALVLAMTMTSVFASHVLDRRLKVFGQTSKNPRTKWVMLLLAALATLMIGAAAPAFYSLKLPPPVLRTLLWTAYLLATIPLLWLIGGLARPLFGVGHPTLGFATLHRLLVPGYSLAFVTLALALPLHVAIERHWMKKDRLMDITPEAPAITRYEWDVTQQLRRELLKVL
jgi:hypothetical protein